MLPAHEGDTIAAVSTASGRSGIGIVRVSGALSGAIARGVLGLIPKPRLATWAKFCDGKGQELDSGLALWFCGPSSYTGEDLLELHGHGNPVLLAALLRYCCELGARQAQPGEFTKRAFLNGKLDLAQAEGVSALIEAKSLSAARGALRSLSGEFSERVRGLKDQLVDLRARIEASLDFPEEDLDLDLHQVISERLRQVSSDVGDILTGASKGKLLTDGVKVTLLGRPNVGKSSIMNRLAKEDVAIVTEIPGTTRDALRESVQIGELPVLLTDTAGIRETDDVVEKLGVGRALDEMDSADLVLIVTDASRGIEQVDVELAERVPIGKSVIWVQNKIDLLAHRSSSGEFLNHPVVGISAKTGFGFETLEQAILDGLGCADLDEGVFSARERHLSALRQVLHSVQSALCLQNLELVADDLRRAQLALGAIVGEITSDDLLGEIFSRFCIGK
jgi:tRNA modification GTPase